MSFDNATRRQITPLTQQSKPSGGGTVTWQLPRSGLLARVFLLIRGNVAGTLSNQNAFGFSSVVRRVRLTTNNAIDVFSMSGPGYHHLFRDQMELQSDSIPGSTGRTAITATTFNADMVIPVMLNQRDPIGLIMLQSEQTTLTLTVDFEADASVATGATVTATVTPYIETFTVPVDEQDWPPLTQIHQILEESTAVAASGEFVYNWPRGNVYLQVIHGLGFGVSGSDAFTRVRTRVNQSTYLLDVTPNLLDLEKGFSTLTQRRAGVIPIDLMGSSGLGLYDKTRDTINSALVTDLATVIDASGSGTLYTVRRQIVTLG